MPKILLAGSDFRLLGTRAAVLGKTGANVVCCSAGEALMVLSQEKSDLVVLCHTLSDQDGQKIIDLVHKNWPQTRILRVVSDAAQEESYEGVELLVTTMSEPCFLIRRTTELLESLPNHRIQQAAARPSSS